MRLGRKECLWLSKNKKIGLVSGVIRATESESEESERFHFLHFWLCLWHRRLPSSENHIAGVGSRSGRINQSQCLFPSFVIGLRFFRFCLRLRELSFHLIESDGVVVFNDRKVLRFWLRLRLRLTICLISIIWGLYNDSPTLWKTNIFSIVCKAFLSGARSAFILSQDNKSSQRFKKAIPPLRYICKIAFSRPISSDSCGVTFFLERRKEYLILRYVCTEGESGSEKNNIPFQSKMDAKEPQSPIHITGETEAWRVVTQFQALYPKMRIILRRLDKKSLPAILVASQLMPNWCVKPIQRPYTIDLLKLWLEKDHEMTHWWGLLLASRNIHCGSVQSFLLFDRFVQSSIWHLYF